MDKQSDIFPFFPLSLFLFPGEDIPLQIFEPRYKQLIADIRASDATFVIPYVAEQDVREFGSEVRLKEVVAENAGGRMVIIVESVAVVRVMSYINQMEDKLYAGGSVRRLPSSDPVVNKDLKILIKRYIDQFDDTFLNCCSYSDITHQELIKALNLSSRDKYQFICMENTTLKENYLASQLRYMEMIRTQESRLGNDFALN